MTAAEVARDFDIPISTVYKMVRDKKIPFEDVSPKHIDQRRVRFSRAAIVAWLADRAAKRRA